MRLRKYLSFRFFLNGCTQRNDLKLNSNTSATTINFSRSLAMPSIKINGRRNSRDDRSIRSDNHEESYDQVDKLPDIKKILKYKQKGSQSTILANVFSVHNSVDRLQKILQLKRSKAENVEEKEKSVNMCMKKDESDEDEYNEFYLKMTTPKTFYYFPSSSSPTNQFSRPKTSRETTTLDRAFVWPITSPSSKAMVQRLEFKENLIKESFSSNSSSSLNEMTGLNNSGQKTDVKHLFFPILAKNNEIRAVKNNLAKINGVLEKPNGSYFLQSVSYLNLKDKR